MSLSGDTMDLTGPGDGAAPGGEYRWVGLDLLQIADAHPRLAIPVDVSDEPQESEPCAAAVIRAYRARLLDGHEMTPTEALRARPEPGHPGRYEVWDGVLRLRALELVGRERALVRVEDLSGCELYLAMLRENNRAGLSPLELGLLILSALSEDGGPRQVDVARALGRSKQYIGQLVAAAKVSEHVARHGQVDLTRLSHKAMHLHAIHEESPRDLWVDLVEKVVTEGWSAKQARTRAWQAARGGEDAGPGSVPQRPLTATGEVILLGEHRLLCGDAANSEDVRRLVAGQRADAMWTDCPWGVEYEGKTKAALRIPNDTPDDAPILLADALVAAAGEALRPGAPYYLARPSGWLAIYLGLAVLEAGFSTHQDLIWSKDHLVRGRSDYHYRHETITYGFAPGGPGAARFGPGRASCWYGDDSQDTMFEIPRPRVSREHPTIKPVELIEHHLLNSTRRGDRVYDPFAGSGSTLIACERRGRKVLVMEVKPQYCDAICRRFQRETGTMPILESTGEERDYLGSEVEAA